MHAFSFSLFLSPTSFNISLFLLLFSSLLFKICHLLSRENSFVSPSFIHILIKNKLKILPSLQFLHTSLYFNKCKFTNEMNSIFLLPIKRKQPTYMKLIHDIPVQKWPLGLLSRKFTFYFFFSLSTSLLVYVIRMCLLPLVSGILIFQPSFFFLIFLLYRNYDDLSLIV